MSSYPSNLFQINFVGGDDNEKKGTTQLPPDEQFIKKLPAFDNSSQVKTLKGLLKPEQITLMENFTKRQMEESELNLILTTMTNDQIDNLLLVFQADKRYKMKILKYLLKKAG